MSIDNLQNKAIESVQAIKKQKEAEQHRVSEIRANIGKYATVQREKSNNLTCANVDKIMQLDIKQLINHFEKQSEQYKEGSYDMIKTANAKYSIIDNNVAHDFKSDTTHNSLTYLQERLGTTNINTVARELEKITGQNYMEVNYPRVKEVVQEARQRGYNDKGFEEVVREGFNVKYAKLDKDSVFIADREIKLSDIGMNKQEIVKELQQNRAEYQAEEQRQQQRSRSYDRGMSM